MRSDRFSESWILFKWFIAKGPRDFPDLREDPRGGRRGQFSVIVYFEWLAW
jgi:hypothetical protein